jgi:hypothetical protein
MRSTADEAVIRVDEPEDAAAVTGSHGTCLRSRSSASSALCPISSARCSSASRRAGPSLLAGTRAAITRW